MTPVRKPGQRGRLPGQKPKKKGMNYRVHIFRVLCSMNIKKQIKKSSIDILNSVLVDIFKKIARNAGELA